jgi:hypothetical protein
LRGSGVRRWAGGDISWLFMILPRDAVKKTLNCWLRLSIVGSVVGGGMLLAVVLGLIAVAQEPTSRRQAFREIYQELVEINTTNLRAAEAWAL